MNKIIIIRIAFLFVSDELSTTGGIRWNRDPFLRSSTFFFIVSSDLQFHDRRMIRSPMCEKILHGVLFKDLECSEI